MLPIRPGWERAFLSVLATGSQDGLDGKDHPYMTVAKEIESYAKTNYPGIVPANPEDVDPEKATAQAEGILIGAWYEYTPTSALDIKVGEAAPAEGTYGSVSFAPENPWAKAAPLLDAVTEVLKAAAKRILPSLP